MSLKLNDRLTPELQKKLAKISDKRPVLSAAGAALASVATRAFRNPALRPEEWPALSPKTLASKKGGNVLIETGALFRSMLAQEPTSDSVEVGTDREYALFHQFGTKKMPARPFFPIRGDNLIAPAEKAVEGAMRAQINALLN